MGDAKQPRHTSGSTADDLRRAAEAAGVALTTDAISRFNSYLDTLLLWRVRLSLTATATRSGIIRAHIADALHVAPLIESGFQVADLGSGAGFPGVPLAIVCSGARFTLIESRRKRANFLREVVRRVQLANVEVIEARAESVPDPFSGVFDVAVSRAVWHLTQFLEISRTLLRVGGLAIAMRTLRAGESQDFYCGFSQHKVVAYQTPGGAQHVLFVYRKVVQN
jgi:16S rRNA (guanine527-N7)-methyltransferase